MFFTAATIPPDVEVQRQLTSLHIDQWIREDLFEFGWWLLLVSLVLCFFLWWKVVDKKRLPEILLYAALSAIVVMAKVEYGEELKLWDYPIDIIPIFPPLTSLDLIGIPMIYSLIFQLFRTNKSFLWATLITTAVICFILEPIMAWVGFYELLRWKYYLNYPIYAGIAIAVRAAVNRIYATMEAAN